MSKDFAQACAARKRTIGDPAGLGNRCEACFPYLQDYEADLGDLKVHFQGNKAAWLACVAVWREVDALLAVQNRIF